MTIDEIVALGDVIPVVVIDDAADAVPLAEALVAEGMPAIEVTLRTRAALPAIERMAEVPGAVVGAGTVTSGRQARDALRAGARFLVTPGTTPRLLDALEDAGAPFLPGAATPSEMLALLERGIGLAKFFPAEASGGVAAVRALAGPFPDLRLCPTGGIDAVNVRRYLAEPNVACVGGSWMCDAARGPSATPPYAGTRSASV